MKNRDIIFVMKKSNKIVLLVIFLIVIVCGVYVYMVHEYKAEVSAGLAYHNQNLSPGDFYINKQYGFEIIPPANWVIADENQVDGIPVEFVDRTKNVQGLIRVSFTSQSTITSSNFDTSVNNSLQKVKDTPGVSFISNEKIVPSKIPSYLLEYIIDSNKGSGYQGSGKDHILQLTSLTKDGQVFIVTGMVDETMWSNFKDVVKDSLLSFSIY